MTTGDQSGSETHSTAPETRSEPDSGFKPPIEVLDAALDSPAARRISDSTPQHRWHECRSDLTAFGYWLAGRNWTDPTLLGGYLRALEGVGASFSMIERRTTSITTLVAILAATGDMASGADPAKHPTTKIALKAIRRRLGTDVGEARSLSAEGLIEVLSSIDDTKLTGRRDIAMLLVAWFGTLRVSQITGIRLDAVSIDDGCATLTLHDRRLPKGNTSTVSLRRMADSRWCPTTALESWLTTLHALAPGTDVVWPRMTNDDTLEAGAPPLGHDEIDGVIARRVRAAGAAPSEGSPARLHTEPSTADAQRATGDAGTLRHARLRPPSIGKN